jgi:hypothetical protein
MLTKRHLVDCPKRNAVTAGLYVWRSETASEVVFYLTLKSDLNRLMEVLVRKHRPEEQRPFLYCKLSYMCCYNGNIYPSAYHLNESQTKIQLL